MSVRIHPTAIIEDGVDIGDGSSVWDTVHIRGPGTRIGRDCIVGEKTYIAYGVEIGDLVKINAFVYICNAVTIERGVMISAGTVFTNDLFPRATDPDLAGLRTSAPDEHTLPTLVREGATIGARCTIGCDLEIGRFAMIGMSTLVTRSIPDFHLAVGHPARTIGYVCRCGEPTARFDTIPSGRLDLTCPACSRTYSAEDGVVTETSPALETAGTATGGPT